MIKLPSPQAIRTQLCLELSPSLLCQFSGNLEKIGETFGGCEVNTFDFPQKLATYLGEQGLTITAEDRFIKEVVNILSQQPAPIVKPAIRSAASALSSVSSLSIASPPENKTTLFFKAIKKGDLEVFKQLIAQNIDIDMLESTEQYARSPLYTVVDPLTHMNHDVRYEMAKTLLQKGAKTSYDDYPRSIGLNEFMNGPFPLASVSNDAKIIALLYQYDARTLTDPMRHHDYLRSLMDAISRGDLELVKNALSCGMDIINSPINIYMTMGSGGLTPLMNAITLKDIDKAKQLDIIRHLLEAGADVHQPQKQAKSYGDGTNDTLPIERVDDLDVLQLLEKYGIEPNKYTETVATRYLFKIVPLVKNFFKSDGEKTQKAFDEIAKAIKYGASLTAKNCANQTPFKLSQDGYFYCAENKEKLAKMLGSGDVGM